MTDNNSTLGAGGGRTATAGPGSSANDKRKTSCKLVGGEKKRGGHKVEDKFMVQFGVPTATTYKAEADCSISAENPEGVQLMELLPELKSYNVSVKSGKNLQFTLGRIDEITRTEDKLSAVKKRSLWEKYLGKSESDKPADILAYWTGSEWFVFRMDEVIDFIMDNAEWRILESGRIKGDFYGTQYITYEFRGTHNSYFLGANGNKGHVFIKLLTEKIPFIRVEGK